MVSIAGLRHCVCVPLGRFLVQSAARDLGRDSNRTHVGCQHGAAAFGAIRFRRCKSRFMAGSWSWRRATSATNRSTRSSTPPTAGLAGGGGVDGAIHRRGGPKIMAELARRYPQGCATGSAVVTAAGDLAARFVIHAVGPIWQGGHAGEADALASAFRTALTLAAEQGCKSVALPALSCGIYGYPIDQASQIALATTRQFLELDPTVETGAIRALWARHLRRVRPNPRIVDGLNAFGSANHRRFARRKFRRLSPPPGVGQEQPRELLAAAGQHVRADEKCREHGAGGRLLIRILGGQKSPGEQNHARQHDQHAHRPQNGLRRAHERRKSAAGRSRRDKARRSAGPLFR